MDLFTLLKCMLLSFLLSYLLSELLCLSFRYCECVVFMRIIIYLLEEESAVVSEQTDNKYISFMFCLLSMTSLPIVTYLCYMLVHLRLLSLFDSHTLSNISPGLCIL